MAKVAVVVVVALAACSSRDPRPAEEHAAPPGEAQPTSHAEPRAPTDGARAPSTAPASTVRWSSVVRTPNCWFFSGPEGRDDQLVGDVRVETVEREGDQIQLRVGTALFAGTYAHGDLVITRTSTHDYGGPWSATEVIQARTQGTEMVGHYTYTECEKASQECPGRCTITGNLVFSRAPQ